MFNLAEAAQVWVCKKEMTVGTLQQAGSLFVK